MVISQNVLSYKEVKKAVKLLEITAEMVKVTTGAWLKIWENCTAACSLIFCLSKAATSLPVTCSAFKYDDYIIVLI